MSEQPQEVQVRHEHYRVRSYALDHDLTTTELDSNRITAAALVQIKLREFEEYLRSRVVGYIPDTLDARITLRVSARGIELPGEIIQDGLDQDAIRPVYGEDPAHRDLRVLGEVYDRWSATVSMLRPEDPFLAMVRPPMRVQRG